MPSPFFIFKDEEVFICQRAFPHYLARITYFPETDALIQGQITGYSIFTVFAGTLSGNRVLFNNNWKQDLEAIWRDMADWYYKEIEKNPERFKRWKM